MVDDTDSETAFETNHNLNESTDKIRLEAHVTRGTETRDQEKHKLKARGETPQDAAENLSETLAELEKRNVFERARAIENDEHWLADAEPASQPDTENNE